MLKIGTTLGVGIGTLLGVSVAIGLVSYTQSRLVGEKIEEIARVQEPMSFAAAEMQKSFAETAFTSLGYLSTGDRRLLDAFRNGKEKFEQSRKAFANAANLADHTGSAEDFARFRAAAEEQMDLREQQTQSMSSLIGELDAIDALLNERVNASITPDDPLAYKRLQAALEMELHANAITKGLGNFLLTGKPEFSGRVHRAEEGFRNSFDVYRNVLISSDEKRWAEELRRRFDEVVRLAGGILDLERRKTGDLAALSDSYREAGLALAGNLEQRTDQDLAAARDDVLEAGKAANRRILYALLFGVVFGIGAGVVTTRSITGPLRRLAGVMHAIAQGEHVQQIHLTSSGELKAVGDAFNLMTARLLKANEDLRGEIRGREQAQEALRIGEERFRAVFDEAPIGIALTDATLAIVRMNPALRGILNLPEDTGGTLGELLRAEDPFALEALMERLRNAEGDGRQGEIRCVRSDGSSAWLSVNIAPMRGSAEGSSHYIVMMEDVSTRRAAEQEMRMMAQTLTSMNEGVLISDLSGVVRSVNPAFVRMYGYGEEEAAGLTWGALPWEAALDSGEVGGDGNDVMHVRKNGERFPVLIGTSVVRDDSGSPVAMVTIARDMTEERRLQARLEEAEQQRLAGFRRFALSVQQAQESERKRISRELHDDLSQRLSGMKFRVEVLEGEVEPLKRGAGRRLREIGEELDRTIAEVRRISSNLRPSVLDDFGLVTALRLLCKEFEKVHGVRAAFHLAAPAPLQLDATTEIALYRIAQEALANVAKHAHASAVTMHLVQHQSFVELTIQDDGRGFVPGSVLNTRGHGHGLGLMNMQERAELLGGTFEVDAAGGKGTVVSVTIPKGEHALHEQDQNIDC